MTLEAKILEVWRKLPQGPNLHVRRASELDVNEASARTSGMPSILVETSRIFAQDGPSCFGASFRRQSLYSIKRMSMKRTSRAIWFIPLVCVLGCASAPPPDPPPPQTSTSTEQAKPEMVGVYGKVPKDAPAKTEEQEAPVAANPQPVPPALVSVTTYKLAVNDLIDPPVSPAFDAVVAAIQKKDWSQASSALKKILPVIDEKGSIHEKVAAHALAGRIAEQLKNAKKADAEYEIVLGFEKDPRGISNAIEASDGSEDDRRLRQQFSAFAVGEAQYYFAEKKGREADALTIPKYQGSGEKDEVLKFINEKVKDWVMAKRSKCETAQAEYTKILNHHPAPHPRWVIAGSMRVGQMWSKFVDEFRGAPMPKAWLADGTIPGTELTYAELRNEYRAKLIEASEPQNDVAHRAFRTCSDYGTKFKIENGDTQSCQTWLTAHPAKK